MVSLPSKSMPLLIGPFLNRFPVGPNPPLHGPSVSPTKVFLGYLDLSDSLSFRVVLSFQWIPSHAGLMSWQTDLLAKTGATFPFAYILSPLAPIIAKIRHTRYSFWRQNFSQNSLFCQIPSVSSEELALSRLIRCELFRLRCHGQSVTAFSCPLTYTR